MSYTAALKINKFQLYFFIDFCNTIRMLVVLCRNID